MAVVIQMPKLGHTMTEGTVLKWHKHAGDKIREGEAVLTVETDKAEVEIEAPAAGVLAKLIAADGVKVPVGGALGVIAAEGEAVPAEFDSIPNAAPAASPRAVAPKAEATTRASTRRIIASPRAKRIAAEHGVDLASLVGTGADGMITEDDVKRVAEQGASHPAGAADAGDGAFVPARREKLTRIQAVGARNLTASWNAIPHFVQMVRVDMSRTIAVRKAMSEGGAKVGLTDLILAATVRALKENPRINANYDNGEMLLFERVNLGVAVDTPEGLIVPVVHDADRLEVAALGAKVAELAERARNKQLRPTDLEGATFTVSNLGAYGVENGTPVIFGPQVALMFVGAIRDEVLAVDGRAEVRPAMQIAIAYDHRGIDGAAASRFTTKVKAILEAGDFGVLPKAAEAVPVRAREVTVETIGDSLRTRITHGALTWHSSAEDASAPDPVTTFLGALGSCLLMSLRVGARVRKLNVGRASVVARSNEKGHVKEIEVELKVETSEDDDKLHRLVEVAERGCHIRQLIKDEVAVNLKVSRWQ
ncbi:MAG TPA: 2-oxo acid dehydrogenase subunit E2 [Candidatus Binataceae bacterium]|nr:2-oxo acid dehydrogenase subunit E2 [Candidatus Binataceae bacterium]